MPADRRAGRLAGSLLVLALAGCSPAGPAAAPAGSALPSAGSPSPRPAAVPFTAVRELDRAAAPVRLLVPRLGVDAPVGPVGLADDGTVEVPSAWDDVGWYDRGARPGDPGPVVLLGHVDSRRGPAVFFRLREARAGDRVRVVDADGGRHTYAVDRVVRVPKTRFPTDEVYLPQLRPQLRLVTCGGAFDRRSGHYRDNVVVYADPVA